jgi:hypothetical protein
MHYSLHPGQYRAWQSKKRIILVLSGTQAGKTSMGPIWLAREISIRGPGDYIVVAPTFKLLSFKLFPEFLRLFKTSCQWGSLTGKGNFNSRFVLNANGNKCLFGGIPSVDTQIFFVHAQDPDALESATAKGIWLDEAGQKKFRIGSWEAVQRRGSIYQARILVTTTPYQLGWLKDLIYDPWHKAKQEGKDHKYIDVINFKSIENPVFPVEEYYRTKEIMPSWKHRMMYDGEFDRPAGAIYDVFDKSLHTCKPFPIPSNWPCYCGLDFGGVHTAGVFIAKGRRDGSKEHHEIRDDTDRYFLYREYPTRGMWVSTSAKNHVSNIKHGQPKNMKAMGGSAGENQWREEFRVGGLFVHRPPIQEVEPGIDRVYEMFSSGKLVIFDNCVATIDDVQNYSRELTDMGEPTEKIADKETHHYADSLRYIGSYLGGTKKDVWVR